nr:hypothetical protein [Geomonas oryzae]
MRYYDGYGNGETEQGSGETYGCRQIPLADQADLVIGEPKGSGTI